MAKIKHTKNELKAQKEALRRFERFLPMLLLKKQQLQAEIMHIDTQVAEKRAEGERVRAGLDSWVRLFSESEDVEQLVSVGVIDTEEGNIAGVPIPVLREVKTTRAETDLFLSPPWHDDAAEVLDSLIRLRVAREILEEQRRRIVEELRVTSQRVNLFEKVKIPECRENIRVIKIFLGDEQTAAVARGKIAKETVGQRMIVAMKKLTVLCLEDDRSASLSALSDLGVLHITPVTPLRGDDLDTCRRELREAQLTQISLQSYGKASVAEGTTLSEEERTNPIPAARDLLRRKQQLTSEIDALRKEQMILEPYGDFDPATITALLGKRITVRLYHTAGKKPIDPPEGTFLHTIRSDSRGQYFALIGQGEFDFEGSEFPLPTRSIRDVMAAQEALNTEMGEVDSRLAALSHEHTAIRERLDELEYRLAYVSAREGMGAANRVMYLQGFCPVDLVPKVQDAAKRQGWGLVTDDPAEDDQVPTLIRNRSWVRPIDCLFAMLDVLPGYREVDIRSVFLIFFTLFFAILVGDAGYGAIFLAIAIYARFKMKDAPREPFRLVYLLSAATIIWGAITGNYFGIASLPAPLRGFEIPWMKNDENLMAFSFLVGAIHLTIAHIWSALQKIKSTRALGDLGWICMTWFMYFLASNMILGAELPGWSKLLFPVAMALLVLFITPFKLLKEEWADHIMLPFDVIGNFADLVSYVRLFAVGSAGLAVAIAFNELAIGTGIEGVGGAIKASIVLFLGHCLNIVLCLMSILVHGVRLNTLEFSNHVGLEWAGFKYEPFATRGATEQNV